MDDIIGKIGELLSDKESMKQLSELASMFMNDSSDSSSEQDSKDKSGSESSESCDVESDGEESASSSGGFDFGMLFRLQEIMGSFSQKDINSELLMALKPHLSEERQEKVDKAVKLLRLLAVFSILKESGILEDLL